MPHFEHYIAQVCSVKEEVVFVLTDFAHDAGTPSGAAVLASLQVSVL